MARLAQLLPAPLKPAARRARDELRRLRWAPLHQVLAPAEARAVLTPLADGFHVERRQRFGCPVRVRNAGPAVLSSQGRCPVRLVSRWLGPGATTAGVEEETFSLPYPLHPGESAVVHARLTAPDFLGQLRVEFDLSQPTGDGFAAHGGGQPAGVAVEVTGRAADEIDYFRDYAAADLGRDFWTVVGPPTKDEFDRLAQAKLHLLRTVGLTPDSRVLDVGCGTGQLAGVLEPFLSDSGSYLGTDIGRPAIDFCTARYRRPNFAFAVNDMTTLPVAGRLFDVVACFSVFTHTYPDETALLMADAGRALAPGGVILADVFTSPLVERYVGHRGAVEVNRDHFLRLAGLAGLTATVVMTDKWGRYGTREFLKFTRVQ